MPAETTEEYLECVYDLTNRGRLARNTDIAACMGVAPASATEMVQRLAAEGLLEYEKYKGATLTDKGLGIAKRLKRKHRIIESFLVNVLGLGAKESHDEACRLEHTISDESERKICQMMNNPQTCPDGEPIPYCEDSCGLCESEPSVPLADMEIGVEGSITHMKCDENPSMIRRLISMGFVPGRNVTVEERTPANGPLVVKLCDNRVALGRDYAALVHVKSTPAIRRFRRRRGRTVV